LKFIVFFLIFFLLFKKRNLFFFLFRGRIFLTSFWFEKSIQFYFLLHNNIIFLTQNFIFLKLHLFLHHLLFKYNNRILFNFLKNFLNSENFLFWFLFLFLLFSFQMFLNFHSRLQIKISANILLILCFWSFLFIAEKLEALPTLRNAQRNKRLVFICRFRQVEETLLKRVTDVLSGFYWYHISRVIVFHIKISNY
jgi:hypothetical protein